MLFGPGSLGIAFCRRPRVIYRAVSARGLLPCLRPYFSSSNYTLLKRWKNLKSPLKRDRFSSFALCRCYTLFISLTLSLLLSFSLSLFRFISRAFDCVSWRLQRYHPYRLVLSFSSSSASPSQPLSLPAYKRFDWNRSASRQAGKQARHLKWSFLPLFLFPPLELLLASPCFPPSFSLSFAPLRHYRSYLHRHCIVQATSTCNFFRFLISLYDDATKK